MAFDDAIGRSDSISQINVTPLVDVMLVLLVIFMVTAPILQQGVSIDLPKAKAGGARRGGGAARRQGRQEGYDLSERQRRSRSPTSARSSSGHRR